jgi:hypothetical protein
VFEAGLRASLNWNWFWFLSQSRSNGEWRKYARGNNENANELTR